MLTDLAKLVDLGKAAEDGIVADLHMSGQAGVVGHDDVVPQHAVMGDVHIGHDPVVVADARDAGVLDGAAIDGAKFTDGVVVADDQLGVFVRVLSCPAERHRWS